MTPPISIDLLSYLFFLLLFLALVLCFCISHDRITIVSSYPFVPLSLRCTMVSTQRRNLCFFPFLFFLFFLILFFVHLFFNESSRLWWRDAIRTRIWLSVLCSWSQQNCDIFWDSSWPLVALFFFFFNVSICLKSDQLCWIRYAFLPILEITRR